MARTRSDAAEIRLQLKDVDKLHPKNWPGSKHYAGFAGEIAAWLWYTDPKQEAGWGGDSAHHVMDLERNRIGLRVGHDTVQRHGRCTEGHSNGAEPQVRSIASAG